MATSWKYLPILKWKQGERIALRELTPPQWDGLVPVLELVALEVADSEDFKSALSECLKKVAEQIEKTFPLDKPVAIDTRFVAPNHPRQSKLLATICKRLQRDSKRVIFPVITDKMIADSPKDLGLMSAFDEYLLRIQTLLVDPSQIIPYVGILTAAGLSKKRLHLVVDQYSMVREDPAVRFGDVRPYLDQAILAGCASVTAAGGSFPINLIGLKQGIHDIPRVEWAVWSLIRKAPEFVGVRYSDYAVTNPAPLPNVDPTEVNPSVAIRYTADSKWVLFKAGGFKKGAPDQYKSLCKLLTADPVYSGATFSFGDGCYEKAALGKLGNGNPSSWRRDATSHHLVFTSSKL